MLRLDLKTLYELARNKAKGIQVVDDHTMLMERVIRIVAELPHNSRKRVELTNDFIGELWYSLEHPPMNYIGERFQYRMADGSYNVGAPHRHDRRCVDRLLTLCRTSSTLSWARRERRTPGRCSRRWCR